MNSVNLVGRLARSPELRYTEKGKAMCFITLAVDGFFSKAEGKTKTHFIDVKMWGKTAENVAKHLIKGSMIAVEAYLESSSYEKNGQMVYKLEVVADRVKFLSKPKSAVGGE